jgi:SAM-dependent methyltransferase
MGCGGGKNVFTLKNTFKVTGVDISPAMLDLAKKLNPECTFIQGDIRTCQLGSDFDVVFVDDAIPYMKSKTDLLAVFKNAYQHLCTGGLMIVEPDYTKETFEQNRTRVTHANPKYKPAHVDVTFIENDYDPDPNDDTFEGTMIYLIRENGKLRIEKDISEFGLFTRNEWWAVLREAGYEVYEEASTGEQNSMIFVCEKV